MESRIPYYEEKEGGGAGGLMKGIVLFLSHAMQHTSDFLEAMLSFAKYCPLNIHPTLGSNRR